jgi:hypothetical protein
VTSFMRAMFAIATSMSLALLILQLTQASLFLENLDTETFCRYRTGGGFDGVLFVWRVSKDWV